jgi:hypothetical protein
MEPHEMVTSFPGEKPGDPHQEVRSLSDDPSLFEGPPYAVVESVFDEYARLLRQRRSRISICKMSTLGINDFGNVAVY